MSNLRSISPDARRKLGILLKATYDAVLAEPIPQSIHDTLRRLK